MSDQPRGLTPQQVAVLLYPLDRARVHRDPGGNSYLPQQDVRAHLTRVFGFGNWSMHVLDTAQVYVGPAAKANGQPTTKVDCLWRATVRLEVRDQHGNHLATYEDAATGDAQNSTPLAAHDLALKSAVSTALKRAATSLGDQFGLSLYNKGSLNPFVGVTLVGPEKPPAELGDVPAATEEQDPDARAQAADLEQEGPDPSLSPAAAGPEHVEEVPQPPAQSPEERAEQAVERAQRARDAADHLRHGPALRIAQARAWDALTETMPQASRDDRTAALEAELRRRDWPMLQQLSAEHLDTLTDHYRQEADDAIRQHHATHPDA